MMKSHGVVQSENWPGMTSVDIDGRNEGGYEWISTWILTKRHLRTRFGGGQRASHPERSPVRMTRTFRSTSLAWLPSKVCSVSRFPWPMAARVAR